MSGESNNTKEFEAILGDIKIMEGLLNRSVLKLW